MADLIGSADEPEKSGDPADMPELESERPHRDRLVPMVVTVLAILAAAIIGWGAWDAYMVEPWTRDGRVRVYLKIIAPEVAGKIVEMPVVDNQFVHKGDLLMTIDPKTYAIAVAAAEAEVQKAKADMDNKIAMSSRREKLTTLSTSVEERETMQSLARAGTAAYHQAEAALEKAKVELERTRIVSPVDGWITNLLWQLDDYASVGEKKISIIDAHSFWIDAYFEESSLSRIHVGDPASAKLMGFAPVVHGHVEGISRGITVDNAQAGPGGLAIVNPVFTWVRLAQRFPVRIHIDEVPPGVFLAAGETATVQIEHPAATAQKPDAPGSR
jgi:multidrug resistance efflux pump